MGMGGGDMEAHAAGVFQGEDLGAAPLHLDLGEP